MKAYEDVFTSTSTDRAPWHIIPADNKWFMRAAVASIITETRESLTLDYPMVSADQNQRSWPLAHDLRASGRSWTTSRSL